MAEYIERDAVIDLVDKGFLVSNANYGSVSRIVRQIPAADVQPVRRGRWLPIVDGNEYGDVFQVGCYCSECGEGMQYEPKYCPACGADMRGES